MGLLFPLSVVPSVTWHRNPTNTHFGAPRGGGFPVHGACDLVVPAGTEVLAMEDGRIIRGPYQFVCHIPPGHHANHYLCDRRGAHAAFIARYCEIAPVLPPGVHAGATVTQGQVIASVGLQIGHSMLHFEMFNDPTRLDILTDRSDHRYLYVPQANYKRRNDLLDPTDYFDACLGPGAS